MQTYDVIIIGAGAAGLMAASRASSQEKSVLVIESNRTAGRKIIISGGGRCNFTNTDVESSHFLSENEHFVKSSLKQYSNWDFIDLVANADIKYHEKSLGQLFCDSSAKDILELLLKNIDKTVDFKYGQKVLEVSKDDGFKVKTTKDTFAAKSVIVATGGLSIPTMGASPIGHRIAKDFGHKLIETSPALVPFTLSGVLKDKTSALSGVSLATKVQVNGQVFSENLLFTHRGLSGPAILKASLFWYPTNEVVINLLPSESLDDILKYNGKKKLKSVLKKFLPERFLDVWFENIVNLDKNCAEFSRKDINLIDSLLHNWKFVPAGTEGYRKAEVTRGGVSTEQVSSKTMESMIVPGLFFVGEVLDVTGLLGGYNFQWAWSSGFVAGNNA